MDASKFHRLKEVAGLFLKLGTIGFGGPAAHIALMHDEVVTRRKWLDDQQFLDLLGVTQLIPGPNSTEMASHIGFRRSGWLGLIAGGLCFTLPAMLIVMALSWVYVRYGSTPQAGWISYGIKPVIIGVLLQALWVLGRKAVKDKSTALAAFGTLGLYFLGVNEIALLLGGALAVMLIKNVSRTGRITPAVLIWPLAGTGVPVAAAKAFSFPLLFLTFLKIGSVLYGSGFVLLAYFRADFVNRLGWITDQQLMDAIAIGQVTPGPLFTSATFIGYLLAGPNGALLATLGIFLPSFLFVAAVNPFIPRLRKSPWTGGLLDGVNAASMGLMAAVTCQLARVAFIDLLTVAVAAVSLILLARMKINPIWLVAGGALMGLIRYLGFPA
ncbi:MAG: chromate efflux transporter [Candidatus Omnitrophica bacterium]|nr:chromate efflux transporter [Candidatus Omnitrophota bacterium]